MIVLLSLKRFYRSGTKALDRIKKRLTKRGREKSPPCTSHLRKINNPFLENKKKNSRLMLRKSTRAKLILTRITKMANLRKQIFSKKMFTLQMIWLHRPKAVSRNPNDMPKQQLPIVKSIQLTQFDAQYVTMPSSQQIPSKLKMHPLQKTSSAARI